MPKQILLVDDEAGIVESLSAVLSDEGYNVEKVASGDQALESIARQKPDLVILDIWMPGKDGIETLKQIKSHQQDLPVVMISGHASISTAVKATQLGAENFVEKPIDLEQLLETVKSALDQQKLVSGGISSSEGATATSTNEKITKTKFFKASGGRTVELQQKTVKGSSISYGLGVHSGQKSGLILEPLPANSGIHFAGLTSQNTVAADIKNVTTTGFATTLKLNDVEVSTVEHLLSALHAYGITNLLIKCNREVPVMDGSAKDFCRLLEETGIEEQSAKVAAITVCESITVGTGVETITLEPADHDYLEIDYTLVYPEPVGTQHHHFIMDSPQRYQQEIAPCRTFGFVKDINNLQKQGLAQGGRFNNFVLIGDKQIINSELRFANEAARHKILDIIGDIYLLSQPVIGKITAKMTGHSDNIALLKELKQQLLARADV